MDGARLITSTEARDQFLQLLTTQLRYQNPLDPMDNTEFVAQLAQLSTLEQLEELNSQFENLLRLQEVASAADLVGRNVQYRDVNRALEGQGVVEAVAFEPDGYYVVVNGQSIPLEAVRGLY